MPLESDLGEANLKGFINFIGGAFYGRKQQFFNPPRLILPDPKTGITPCTVYPV
jgi:hypothetical protein